MSAPKLKPCPACGGTATLGCAYVVCNDTACNVTGPQFDRDGSKWNALPRREDAPLATIEDTAGMSDGELIARSIWASAALRIVAAGEGAPNGSRQSLIDSLEVELDRRAAARKAAQ